MNVVEPPTIGLSDGVFFNILRGGCTAKFTRKYEMHIL
jgi:hypothetical protein